MDINLIIIVSLLVVGSGYTSYRIGVMEGIKATVNFIEESLEYMILNTHIDTVNGDITYYIQNFLSSNYGMVFVSGGVYIIIEQIPDYFTKLNGILCFEL